MAQRNCQDSINTFGFESETEDEKEKENMNNKLVKMGGILVLCFLLLNFVLVVIAMNRTSEFSPSFSTKKFSAAVNQTNKNAKNVEEMKFELGGIEKWMNSTEEKFESHQFQIESLSNRTKIDKLEALDKENGELKKSHEELKEQFESLSQKIDQLEKNISTWNQVQNVPLVTSTPEMRTTPAENKDEKQTDLPHLSRSCSVAMEFLPSPRSKKQTIYPHGNRTSLEVLCDFETDGGGWTIIQKRSSGPKQEFSQNWNEYKIGFGSLEGNFWMGLENIHALTKNGDQELRIDLEDFQGNRKYAKYSSFSISDASDFYRLALGGFYANSTLQDSFYFDNGIRFTTIDKDNDNLFLNCAVNYGGGGGWWFNGCSLCNLNGAYFAKGETVQDHNGIWWQKWKGSGNSFAKTEMKIRTRKSE